MRIMVNLLTTIQLSSTAHAYVQNAKVAERLPREPPTSGGVGRSRFGRAREFSMQLDRATTEKAAAMLGITLSLLFLMAIIAFAFV
jgi:hypothetical protein